LLKIAREASTASGRVAAIDVQAQSVAFGPRLARERLSQHECQRTIAVIGQPKRDRVAGDLAF
jgi:hypothetical protein